MAIPWIRRSLFGNIAMFCLGFVGACLFFQIFLTNYKNQIGFTQQSTLNHISRYFAVSSNDTKYKATNDTNYRSRFTGLWDKYNPSIGLDSLVDPRKYIIYRCGGGMSGCGGWADRVKGMIIGYIIANLTGRVFKIENYDPECSITNSLIPNKVDWRLPQPFHKLVKPDNPPPDSVVLDYFRHPNYIVNFKKINVSHLFNQSVPYVYMKANLDYMDSLKKTTVYPHQLAWMKDLRKDQIFSEFYRRIFRYSPDFQKRLSTFLNHHLPTPQHKLICAHIRMGHSSTIPKAYEPVRMKPEFLPTVWDFIHRHSTRDLHKVFVMTDSEDTVREANRQKFTSRLITTPGEILHIDYSRKKGNTQRCQALEKVLFDQVILMNCDILLISKSGLSRMAAFVRGSDEGLYCLFPYGNITKCSANEFTQLYHILG